MTSRNLTLVGFVLALACTGLLEPKQAIGQTSAAAAVSVAATDIGWYNSVGDHPRFAKSIMTGSASKFDGLSYRSYMVFDLSTISVPAGQILRSATLQLYADAGGYDSPDFFERLNIYDVSTPISSLMFGQTGATAIYDDLGSSSLASGAIFGSTFLGSSNFANRYVNVGMASAALDALNAAFGSRIAFGGAVTSLGRIGTGVNELLFTNSYGLRNAQGLYNNALLALTFAPAPPPPTSLSAVPEPSTIAGGLIALAASVLVVRARRKQSSAS